MQNCENCCSLHFRVKMATCQNCSMTVCHQCREKCSICGDVFCNECVNDWHEFNNLLVEKIVKLKNTMNTSRIIRICYKCNK